MQMMKVKAAHLSQISTRPQRPYSLCKARSIQRITLTQKVVSVTNGVNKALYAVKERELTLRLGEGAQLEKEV